jgi:hypothetical protein
MEARAFAVRAFFAIQSFLIAQPGAGSPLKQSVIFSPRYCIASFTSCED